MVRADGNFRTFFAGFAPAGFFVDQALHGIGHVRVTAKMGPRFAEGIGILSVIDSVAEVGEIDAVGEFFH